MNFSTLNFSIDSDNPSIGVLKINRPQAMNALNQQVIADLETFFSKSLAELKVRVLIVSGEGEKAFVAGADIKEMQTHTPDQARAMATRGQKVFQMIEDSPVVTIAAVNGFALGGGLELAMACDFMVASRQAKFGLPEVSLGLIPGYGGTQRLSRFVGKSIARMVTLTGDIFSAERGFEWGLFVQIVEPSELFATCQKLAQTISRRGPQALALAKRAINMGYDRAQSEGQSLEAELFAQTFMSQDHHEGISAFIERRSAQFKGN